HARGGAPPPPPPAGACGVRGRPTPGACLGGPRVRPRPGPAPFPAVHADRLRAAEATGEAAVRLATSRLTPDRILPPPAFENALRVLLAIGGSANAIIHLPAHAGRPGVPSTLTRPTRLSAHT